MCYCTFSVMIYADRNQKVMYLCDVCTLIKGAMCIEIHLV